MLENVEVILEGDLGSLKKDVKDSVKFVLFQDKLVFFANVTHSSQVCKHGGQYPYPNFLGAGDVAIRTYEGERMIVSKWGSFTCRNLVGKDRPQEDAEEILKELNQKALDAFQS